jgi:glycosyltransferase involved in cell wall biosynthesis
MNGVSILVPVFNHEKWIFQCLDSIYNQEVKFPIEIIILDDASTDRTEKIINDFINTAVNKIECEIKYLRNKENLGLIENVINGFSNVAYDLIAICEGDDFWTYNLKLQEQYEVLTNLSSVSCNFMWYNELHEEGMELKPAKSDPFPVSEFQTLDSVFKGELRIPTRTVMFRKSIIDKDLIYDLRQCNYYDLVLNFHYFKKGDVTFTDKVCATYRKHLNGLSSNSNQSKIQMRKTKMKIWIGTWDIMISRFGNAYLDSYKLGINKFYNKLLLGNEGEYEYYQIILNIFFYNLIRPVSFREKFRLIFYLFRLNRNV